MSLLIETPQPIHQTSKAHGIHALQGIEFPHKVKPDVTERLLWILAQAGQLKAELDRVYSNSFQQNVKEGNTLSDEIRYNNYWQAATNLAVAFGAILAGGMAAQAGMDATSAVTIVTKGGEGVTSWLRGTETWKSNKMRMIEHRTSKGAEGGKRLADFVQQLQQAVRTYLDHLAQQKHPK
jgi:hypothetical protein